MMSYGHIQKSLNSCVWFLRYASRQTNTETKDKLITISGAPPNVTMKTRCEPQHVKYHFEEHRNEEVASISKQSRNVQPRQTTNYQITTRPECPSRASASLAADDWCNNKSALRCIHAHTALGWDGLCIAMLFFQIYEYSYVYKWQKMMTMCRCYQNIKIKLMHINLYWSLIGYLARW